MRIVDLFPLRQTRIDDLIHAPIRFEILSDQLLVAVASRVSSNNNAITHYRSSRCWFELSSSAPRAVINSANDVAPGSWCPIDWSPCVRARPLRAAIFEVSCAARVAAQETSKIAARKGRARTHGDQSIGHQDPGATSFALLMTALGAELETSNQQREER